MNIMKQCIMLIFVCFLHITANFAPPPTLDSLPAKQAEDFEEAAEVYLDNFQNYVGELAKTKPDKLEKLARLSAHIRDLFVNTDKIIEIGWVANNTTSKQEFNVNGYINRILTRKTGVYSRMEISPLQKIGKVKGFAKTNEARLFKATYRFYQLFKGYAKENVNALIYSDSTVKIAEVYGTSNGDDSMVKLGNITVEGIKLLGVSRNTINIENSEPIVPDVESATPSRSLLEQVKATKATKVRLIGKNNYTTRILSFEAFAEKYEYGEFKKYKFDSHEDGEAVIKKQ